MERPQAWQTAAQQGSQSSPWRSSGELHSCMHLQNDTAPQHNVLHPVSLICTHGEHWRCVPALLELCTELKLCYMAVNA